jgi:predicted lysophospholipase L1 biosynthesis ABC-type transport system permease subunit
MIVNQALVKRFFADRHPIGRRVYGWGQWFTVIGVAQDSKYHQLAESPLPYFYVPFRQVYRADMPIAFYVRTAGDPDQTLVTLRREVRAIDPNVGVFEAMPLAEHIGGSLYVQKVAAMLMSVLGAIALLLAAVGLYSVISYAVSQRTHEIGIRMALGAQPRDVLKLVIQQGMLLALIGVGIGLGAAFGLTRLMKGLLFGVTATDPLTFVVIALLLMGVALLACYLPARRATKVDPMIALRYE